MGSLDEWPAFPEREWLDFTPSEVRVVLAACVKNSAPGLDHIMWSHLKLLLADVETCTKVVNLANAGFEQGHWPTFFFFFFFLKPTICIAVHERSPLSI
jgi:hypothetical protein